MLLIVYFDQIMGAGHSICKSKYAFSTFDKQKVEKLKKLGQNSAKKNVFLSLHPNASRRFYSQKKLFLTQRRQPAFGY